MKVVQAIILIVPVIVLLNLVVFQAGPGFCTMGSAVAVTAPESLDESDNPGSGDESRDSQLTDDYETKNKIIVLAIFGVLFIICMYWWTHGKLHHKLPKY